MPADGKKTPCISPSSQLMRTEAQIAGRWTQAKEQQALETAPSNRKTSVQTSRARLSPWSGTPGLREAVSFPLELGFPWKVTDNSPDPTARALHKVHSNRAPTSRRSGKYNQGPVELLLVCVGDEPQGESR